VLGVDEHEVQAGAANDLGDKRVGDGERQAKREAAGRHDPLGPVVPHSVLAFPLNLCTHLCIHKGIEMRVSGQ
jgi:hypothetical protein